MEGFPRGSTRLVPSFVATVKQHVHDRKQGRNLTDMEFGLHDTDSIHISIKQANQRFK